MRIMWLTSGAQHQFSLSGKNYLQSLKLMSLVATISTCVPSMIQQIKYPSNKGLLYGLLNSAFAFYFFSFQVHEKSILLPLLPASLLAPEERLLYRWLAKFSLFSMFPILCRYQLVLPHSALFILFDLVFYAPPVRRNPKKFKTSPVITLFMTLLVFLALVLHVIYLTCCQPERYPFLFEAIMMILCFSQFVLLALYTNSRQWMLGKQYAAMEKEKKVL